MHGARARRRAPGGSLSYGDTFRGAQAIAQALLDRGLGPERPVLILSGNSIEQALLTLAEIEQRLERHPAVAMAAVVGVPDPVRTEAIKAWLVLQPGYTESDALAAEIREFVRRKLAAHEYPRHIAVTDSLPMTVTGEVRRGEFRARG